MELTKEPQKKPNKKGKKVEKNLMSVPAEYRQYIFQPNCITNAQYNYTLIQERIFNYIIFYLQTYIKKTMNGEVARQLEIFSKNEDYIDISLPLSAITKPHQYEDVRNRAKEMVGLLVNIEKDSRGTYIGRTQGLLTHVDDYESDTSKRKGGLLHIRMAKIVAELLIKVERENGGPINYTSFLFDVALGAENKYTPRIYKWLSSWKKRAMDNSSYVKKIKYEDLREWLQIGKKYPEFESFKRCILVPVQKEIKEKGDFAFEFQEIRAGKKVSDIHFFYKFPKDDVLTECTLWNTFIMKLKGSPWHVDDKGIGLVMHIKGKYNIKEVTNTIKRSVEFMYDPRIMNDPKRRINDASHYIIKSLLREFPR